MPDPGSERAGPEDPRDGSRTIVLMGVSGSGKSTVMAALAPLLGAVTAEGDAFHSEANVARMRAGIPLGDSERWPWLQAIATWIGERERVSQDAVLTCSALRRRYRDVLREGHPSVRFVHLVESPSVIAERLERRTDHFMPASLLESQLQALEPLAPDEPGFAIRTDGPPSALALEIAPRVATSGP